MIGTGSFAAAKEIAASLSIRHWSVTKSTVPVGTGRELHKIFSSRPPEFAVDIASNSEFLRARARPSRTSSVPVGSFAGTRASGAKHARALPRTGKQHNSYLWIVEAVVNVNEDRKRRMVRKVTDAFGSITARTIAVLGVTFKPDTDDMRGSVPGDRAGALVPGLPSSARSTRKACTRSASSCPNVHSCQDDDHGLEGVSPATTIRASMTEARWCEL